MKNKKFNIILIGSEFTNGTIKLSNFEYPLFLPENILINYTKVENITTDENYFLLIYHHDSTSSNTELINGFDENIKNAISNNNLKVIYFSPHESPTSLIEVIKILTNTIKTNNWKESQFYIINNNSNLSTIKKKFNSNINFYKMNCLLRVVSNMIKPLISEKDIHFDKKFMFLCLNRNPSEHHRIALLTHLKNNNLLENNITDWSWTYPYSISSKNIQSIQHLKKYINPANKNLIKNYLEICNEKKLSYYEQNINWFDVRKYDWSPTHNIMDTFKNSYINIITETAFDFRENDLAITEKSFRPFYYFQIPIFLARPGHIKALRQEYDFCLFDDLIDHSYDDEIDDVKRFHMVLSEIKRLSNMKQEISIYYKNNVDKLIHNHNFIKTYSNRKIEETYFLNLINENK